MTADGKSTKASRSSSDGLEDLEAGKGSDAGPVAEHESLVADESPAQLQQGRAAVV